MALLHSEEKKVGGDAGDQGQGEVIREAASGAQGLTCRRTQYTERIFDFAE